MLKLTAAQKKLLATQQVAHLATADRRGRPHVVPVCYAYREGALFFVVDTKPKRVPATRLKRLRNIEENPYVAVVVDRYDDDWRRLAFVLLHGVARLLTGGEKHARAIRLLRARYPQYKVMPLADRPVVEITIARAVGWGKLGISELGS